MIVHNYIGVVRGKNTLNKGSDLSVLPSAYILQLLIYEGSVVFFSTSTPHLPLAANCLNPESNRPV
jgi:hypothetical protein